MSEVIGQPVTFQQAWDFIVEIEGVPSGGFTDVDGLDKEHKTIEQFEGGKRTVVSVDNSVTIYPEIVCKRGGSNNFDLYDWSENIEAGNTDKRSISIVDQRGGITAIKRYNIPEATLTHYKGGARSSGDQEKNVVEEISFKHTGWKLKLA